MGTIRRHLIVIGRVQGVFFRQSTLHEAQRLNLGGWVRNMPDGSVEIEVEGEEQTVAELVRWAHSGPPSARVESVQQRTLTPTGRDHPFWVKR